MNDESTLLAAHRPLPLDDASVLWLVEEGELLVLASPRDGAPSRPHCLLVRGAGEFLLGGPEGASSGLMGVALHPARLRRVPRAELAAIPPAARARLSAGLDGWVLGLASALAGLARRPGATRIDRSFAELEVAAGQVLEGAPGRVEWIEVLSGSARWMGLEGARLDAGTKLFPLAEGTWIEAEGPLRCRARTGPSDADLLLYLEATLRMQGLVLSLVDAAERARDEAVMTRSREREARSERRVMHALGSLAHLFQSRADPELFDGPPLFRACAAAAEAAGLALSIPRTADDPGRERNPVEAVLRRSNVRCRPVLLRGGWQEGEAGPLVAFLEEGSAGEGADAKARPVALLPGKSGAYELYDPAEESRVPLTPELEARVRRQAFVLYVPLYESLRSRPFALFTYALRGHGMDVLVLVLVGIAATLLGMLVPHATGLLIDSAIPSADRALALQIGAALLMTAIGRMLFELSRTYCMLRVTVASSHKVQTGLMDRLLKLQVGFFRKFTVGDLLDRVMSVQKMFQQLSMASLVALFAGLFTLLNFALLLYYSPKLSALAASIAVVNLVLTYGAARLLVRRDRAILERSSAAFGHVVQLVQGVSKVRAAAAEDRAFASWARRYRDHQGQVLSRQAIDDHLTTINAMLPIVGQLFLFWIALRQIRPDEGAAKITLGDFLAFNSAFGLFLGGVTSLSNTITDVLGVFLLWERSKPIIEAKPEVGGRRTQPGVMKGGIGLQRVTFRYREDCAPVLEEASLEAKPGESIAIVGPSGCGKSTIIRLLLGFEAPERGKVVYDGQDLADLDVDAVRRQVGVVLQTSRVRSNSIFENIAAGSFITMEEAWEAVRRAAFEEDVRRMPMGMHTIVSEGGTNLSGGQRQRLLIARALVKRPRLLLFDEATSALDNRSQSIVTRSLGEMKVTRVVVAHRPSTIRGADRIYVLDRGRVLETGTFDELVRAKGMFHTLMALEGTARS